MTTVDELDYENIDETGWDAEVFGFRVKCYKDLTGTVTEIRDGDIMEVDHIPTFFKAMKRMERIFRERYGGGSIETLG